MSYTDWRIKGPEFGCCNCAWGCPCQFNAPPSEGDCRGMAAMRIDEGHFGDVTLDGLNLVSLYAWLGAVHEGGGEYQIIIDERADAAQREAIHAIHTGEHSDPGATVFNVFAAMIDTVYEPLFEMIDFDIDVAARTASVRVPGLVQSTGEVLGPILHIVLYQADRLDDIVDAVNATGYGLTLGIQSRIDSTVRRIAARTHVGNIYVNRNMIGAVVGVQPFGDEGLSGTGPKAGGPSYLHRFATERTLKVNTAAAAGNTELLSLTDEDIP